MARPKLEDRPSKVNRSERPDRTPINGRRDILSVQGKEEGYSYCWVNEDQVPRYEEGGYDFVTHDVKVGQKRINAASQIGGKISLAVGNQVTAYLMRIPQEWRDEDQKAMDAEVDSKERGMRESLNSKADGRYGEVSISSSKPVARE